VWLLAREAATALWKRRRRRGGGCVVGEEPYPSFHVERRRVSRERMGAAWYGDFV
jgi:hypothetical protein